jgi:hypothetical protein
MVFWMVPGDEHRLFVQAAMTLPQDGDAPTYRRRRMKNAK